MRMPAGGQLAALLTLTFYIDSQPGSEATIRAFVGAYGAYDLTTGQGKQENYLLERPDHALEHFMGATFQQAPEAYRSASPMNYIAQAKTNPQFNTRFLLTWGHPDTVVAPYIEEEFARQLQQAGKQVQTVVIPRHDHFWFVPFPPGEGRTLQEYPNTVVAPQVLEFLRRAL
jgi:pimeloyl-ACP methyl ester carboxylesterase